MIDTPGGGSADGSARDASPADGRGPIVPTPEQLGAMFASLRSLRGLTLAEVASIAGISVGHLSQLERGIGNPSYATLVGLSTALGVPVGSFFAVASGSGLVRADARSTLRVASSDYMIELLTPNTSGRLGAYLAHLPPHWSGEDVHLVHEGEEWCMTLEGTVQLHLDDETHELRVGDAFTWNATRTHWWSNATSTPAQVLTVMTPPSF
ncbi:helix-turn-helix domain-containing protein [Microbacterium sp. RD1]|uniref:helix-turn-helix domain-containing protein n=1 Tax=Microbacterium sp. RD1 TaxID=3457313 RepID=UPI003FA59BC3